MLERRNKGNRRWELDIEFPVRDCNGTAVMAERRHISDRRLINISLEERLMMLAEMPLLHPGQKKRY